MPPVLERLRKIGYDLRWAWSHDAIELCRWDNDLWEASRNNPVRMLGALDQGRLASRWRTISTEHGACVATACDTEPSRKRCNPR